uniref:VWFC domain-containing protein n=1 Tax=Maylandia zebra TaxID=106582 RepID=A0A3P9DPN2_9CICH
MLNLCPFHCVNSYAIESPVSKHECESMFVCVFLFFTEELRCAGVTCPNLQVPSCPEGSVLTKSYKPPAECCPSVPPQCTCDFSVCHKPQCPSEQHPVSLGQASGQPGDFTPKCVHSGKEYSEGEVYRMDPCWLCQCRGGISFCSKAECAELNCENFYIPEGECCPVCIGTHICFIIQLNCGETWNLDECTRCTCRKGRVLCDTELCPPALCQAPIRNKDTCCHVCEYCITSDGDVLLAGDSWKANVCTSCTCNNGTIQCFSQHCPAAKCRVPVLRKGQCCPHCLGEWLEPSHQWSAGGHFVALAVLVPFLLAQRSRYRSC